MKLLSFIILITFPIIATSQDALLLFGDYDHKQFLGCLNCSKSDSGSICNPYGNNGSKYSSNSIWNPYGEYGSKYSDKSPWNRYSNSAPIIVNNSGGSYGYFSGNPYHNDRTRIPALVSILNFQIENDDLEKTRDIFCGD